MCFCRRFALRPDTHLESERYTEQKLVPFILSSFFWFYYKYMQRIFLNGVKASEISNITDIAVLAVRFSCCVTQSLTHSCTKSIFPDRLTGLQHFHYFCSTAITVQYSSNFSRCTKCALYYSTHKTSERSINSLAFNLFV